MNQNSKQIFTILFLLGLVFLSSDLLAANGGLQIGQLNGQIQSATTNVKTWANWIIGAVVLVGTIFSVFALMTGNPNAKNFVIGTVVGLVVWGLVNSFV